ncbi:hypothetical protein N0V88_007582 [Collariella sp. IMI 366227]|nr:hypothetical protein N0V88_007582 [Collariella sp. IMI 366227]
MARTRQTNRVRAVATAFIYVRLPPDFVVPVLEWEEEGLDPDADSGTEQEQQIPAPEPDEKWLLCFRALQKDHDFLYLKIARQVEDPAAAIIFLAAFTPEGLEGLLESLEYKACLSALDLDPEQPPAILRTVKALQGYLIKPALVIIIIPSLLCPVTEEQREAATHIGGAPIPLQFDRHNWPWDSKFLVKGQHMLPDGREVEYAIVIQSWREREQEDVAAGRRGKTGRGGLSM